MKTISLTLFLMLSVIMLSASEISPMHPNIQYIGRFDMTNVLSPKISWPGSQLNFRFEGTSLKIKLNSIGETFYWVQVDKVMSKITISQGSKVYTLASGLADGEHAASIIKIAAPWTPQNFEGILIDDGKTLLPAPERKVRKIEFYGDSQTQGAQVEIAGLLTDEAGDAKDNNYFSYAPILARALNAEYVCIAQSGASLTVQPNKLTIPACFDRTGAGTQYSMWDFSKWTPDVVCINLGVNDNPLPANYTTTYIDFVRKIRAKYPNVHIFLLSGPMYQSQALESGIISALQQLSTGGDSKVYYFKPTGYINHPGHNRTVDNVLFSKELSVFIKTKTWNQTQANLSPEEIFITPISIPLAVNARRQLSAVVLPFDASNQQLVWSSSNTGVAIISNDGTVTGISAGKSIITARTANGTVSYNYELDVSNPIAENMILNPGFENNLTNWSNWSNSKINTSIVNAGNKSLEISPGAGGCEQIITFAIEPNTTYTFSVRGKILTGSPNALISIKYLRLNGQSVWLSSPYFNSNVFDQKSITFTTPADVFSIHAIIQQQSAGTTIFDNAELIKGTKPTGIVGLIDKSSSLRIVPNPVTDGKAKFIFKNSNTENTLKIYSLTGKKVIEKSIVDTDESIQLASLAKGYYVAEIATKNNVVSNKFYIK